MLDTRLRAFITDTTGGGTSISTASLVDSSRTISTVYPLSGGGNLSQDRTFSVDTALLVNTGRTISTLYPLSGGGNLSADRTFSADTSFLVTSARTLTMIYPLSGGGNLGIDRTTIIDTAFLINTGRTITASTGLTGGGDFSADRILSVNTNVRDKTFGIFMAGSLSPLMMACSAMIYIPYNMELREVRMALSNSAGGQNVVIQPTLWNSTLLASSGLFAQANKPIIVTNNLIGSHGAIVGNVLHAGSFLGVQVDSVGTTVVASNLTVTFVVRTS